MMKTDQAKKVIIKIDSEVQQENVKNTRRGLKTIQPTTDKENFSGRIIAKEGLKFSGSNEPKKPKPLLMHKETQTEKYITDIDDLTGEEAGLDYWKRLAEKRQECLDESFQEIEKLKGNIETLQEENKICKEMLDEARSLVEVLQEMMPDEEAAEDESTTTKKKDSETDSN
ncbi:unnamed protein product [Ceutorhynchus assimilis]|uniref:Geminin n=1 Tax=Ceutorhynchus assimilis TaxID=467358 RepID=A0A9N9MXQ7_9CUCU|nr:unnamed protein product [Ceutorhynchus assimilis]